MEMYSEEVMDHFSNPRNTGELPDATARVEGIGNPACGDVINLAARIDNGQVAAVRYKCSGCVSAIAAGSMLTELMQGRALEDLKEIDDKKIDDALGGLPPASHHAAQLAASALRALLTQLKD
jgi:nitrogen fixation NifU-like protein